MQNVQIQMNETQQMEHMLLNKEINDSMLLLQQNQPVTEQELEKEEQEQSMNVIFNECEMLE